ncbi:spore germination protein [Serpentinicella sp. ANB-PHB4]|uniref:spore germination protein n=1 Tax=Serpentinicella sp. ANB-PHB4 TaxID=3074076 RepID=UPI00286259D5|nr:spore germination protein [Serpentinicella sp. ANB-PHB4]MDR5658353.1 spore germination protein [Serpentinicella sp. ANB-PHB4]
MAPFFPFKKAKNKPNCRSTSITGNLKKNLEALKEIFSYPLNKDILIREIYIKAVNKKAALIFIDGITDRKVIEEHIIKPLVMDYSYEPSDKSESIVKEILQVQDLKACENYSKAVKEALLGQTLLLVDGFNNIFSLNTTGYEHRSVEKPESENSLKGPLEAFVESSQVNRSLIRRQLKSEKLISESIELNTTNSCDVSLMYMKNIADKDLVNRIQKRLKQINSDNVQTIGILEQHLEDRPYSLIPSTLFTERPDRAVAFLQEGHVILLMDNSPYCLILPVTFWGLFHTAEDQYLRWAHGNFTRVIRMVALFIALLTPGLYLALTNYHIEMIPTDLLLSMMATREDVPFPAYFELILLEISFELLREAGLRVPNPLGPTIGIVGAIILGQAAVEAGVISPILVVIVAITGLSSFAIANINLNYAVRISRFAFMLAGLVAGLVGVALCFIITLSYLSTAKSFGVPFLTPLSHDSFSKDYVIRVPIWKQWLRPSHISPNDSVRKKPPKKGA